MNYNHQKLLLFIKLNNESVVEDLFHNIIEKCSTIFSDLLQTAGLSNVLANKIADELLTPEFHFKPSERDEKLATIMCTWLKDHDTRYYNTNPYNTELLKEEYKHIYILLINISQYSESFFYNSLFKFGHWDYMTIKDFQNKIENNFFIEETKL
jgi:hypothetical protein